MTFQVISISVEQLEQKLPEVFAIEMNDYIGLYKKSILSLIKKYSSKFDKEVEGKIQFCDTLIFDKKGVSLEKNYLRVVQAGIPTFKLIANYDVAVASVANFFENVYNPNPCVTCPLQGLCGLLGLLNEEPKENRIYDGTRLDVSEKVQIFTNFVKIGYDQYDIHFIFGKKYTRIEGDLYEIKTDNQGKKYLLEVKR